MALHYILDGYNVIKQTSGLAEKKLETARAELVRILESERPQGSFSNKVTIVFDGKPDIFSPAIQSCIRILFTCGGTADDEIKRIVGKMANKKNIRVVTNDRSLQYYVRALGAKILKVDDFLIKEKGFSCEGRKGKKPSVPKNKQVLSKGIAAKINSELENIWLKKAKA